VGGGAWFGIGIIQLLWWGNDFGQIVSHFSEQVFQDRIEIL
jgi:hypothetical protein